MNQSLKYLWGSACILYALGVASAILMSYVGWWLVPVAILAQATIAIWRHVSRDQRQDQ